MNMYRKFKGAAGHNAAVSTHHHSNSSQSRLAQLSDPEAECQVREVWQRIGQICGRRSDIEDKSLARQESDAHHPSATLGDWRTVRVFVSSTFVDFFSEREVLVKKVFPELAEWCQGRKVKLVECDLRWGVPKDATSTQALLTCLEEIDRCYEANGQPFFLSMLGERYGWVPTERDVPAEVREKYSWVDGTSMTFMEILHAALSIVNPNAAFFLRDPGFLSDLPENHMDRFCEDTPLAREHIKALKSYLQEHFPQQTFSYPAKFGGITQDTGRQQVQLSGLEEFASQVTDFFKAAIDRAYPIQANQAQLSPEEKEVGLQWLFVLDKSDTLIGRDGELSMLHDYSSGKADLNPNKHDGKDSTVRKLEDWDCEEGDNLLMAVMGEGGWGKTALLAALVHGTVQDRQRVFYHFVGSTASSKYHDTLLTRLNMALAVDPADPELVKPDASEEDKRKVLRSLLAQWRKTDTQILIVIDGLNELDNSESMYHLSWLPPTLPPTVHCVVSCNVAHRPTMARLYEHPVYCVSLSALDPAALKDIAAAYFGRFGKKLDAAQLEQLVDLTKVDNPLWVSLMCEELRVFGDFRMVDRKLAELPNTMDAFLCTVIKRLIAEDNTGVVKQVVYLVACSVSGLPLDYILHLVGDIAAKQECPLLYWAQARRVLKPYSRTILASLSGDEFFVFVHEAMLKAAQQCMAEEQEEVTAWHGRLADFYQWWCENKTLRINYLPYHLQQARLHPRLIHFLQKDPDAASMHAVQRARFLNDLRCRNTSEAVVPNTKEVLMCQMCRNRSRGFNPGVLFPNKDVCLICSNIINPNARFPARVCFVHAMKDRMGPSVSPCCVCSKPLFKNTSAASAAVGPASLGPGPAFLCQFCGFGLNGKRCCQFQDFPQ